jgi:hypothetical protein
LAERGPLPADDAQAHCLAAATIARRCSITEAWLASLAKDFLDLLGPGNAEWRDLRADGKGIACARSASGDTSLESCCTSVREP